MGEVEKGTKQLNNGPQTPKKELFSCGVGNIYNDLVVKVMYSFGLLFYMKVAQLSSKQAGLVLVVGEIGSFVSNILFGYCCDNVNVPLLSRRLGKRKAWHLIGTVLVAISITLAFSRCLPCTDSSSSWVAFGYYTFMYFMGCFWYGAVEMGHITTIPEVAKNDDEIVILNSLRTGFSYLGGILTYIVSWIVLGQSGDGELTHDNWKQFTLILGILTVVGLIFVVIFYIGTTETVKKKPRRVSTIFNTAGMYSVSLIFGLDTGEEKSAEDSRIGFPERKSSQFGTALRKISSYFMPFETEVTDETGTFFMSYAARPNRHSTAYMRNQRFSVAAARPIRQSTAAARPIRQSTAGQRQVHYSPQVMRPQRFSLAGQRQVNYSPQALKSKKVFQPSPDCKTREAPSRKSAVWRNPSHDVVPNNHEDSRKSEEPFADKSIEEKAGQIVDQDASKDLPDPSKLTEKNADKFFRPRLLSAIIDECHVEFPEFKDPKTTLQWFKDPELYKVTTFFVCAYSLESVTYSYLALYLMDHLHFKKEATAYFSLVFLVSGLIGTAISKKLNQLVGRMWTYCIASVVAIAAAGWFYFVTESTKQMVYAPIALTGCGVSAMFVMSLSYVAEIISEEKESSGFVYSFVSASHKLTCGAFLLVIQNFYPSASSDPQAPGEYIRWVFAVSLALLPFVGLLVMLIYETMTDPCCTTTKDEPSEMTVISNPSAEDASESLPPDSIEVTEWNTRL